MGSGFDKAQELNLANEPNHGCNARLDKFINHTT